MKRLFLLLPALLFATLSFAQSTISATEIIDKINRNQPVSYKNVTIQGDLDLTNLANRKLDKNNGNWQKHYVSTVTVPLTFENCRFTGDVLAYISPSTGVMDAIKGDSELFTADFTANVDFSGCTFDNAAAFKYSEFGGTVVFAGAKFHEEALFKYAKFSKGPDFSRTTFGDDAVFKYVNFPAGAIFANAAFHGEADFKYAKFGAGGNFAGSTFTGLANFKYASIKTANFTGSKFNGGKDFKYANRKPDSE